MSELGENITDAIKKSQEQNPTPPSKAEGETGNQFLRRIKKILGYGKTPENEQKPE